MNELNVTIVIDFELYMFFRYQEPIHFQLE
jgi:hypothetical protein